MTPDHWEKVQELFDAACKYEPTDRSAYLAKACGGDAEVLPRVQRLLQSDAEAQAERFLDEPAVRNPHGHLLGAPAPVDLAGSQVGPFQVCECIGRGGLGEVYRASDGDLKRDVALKRLQESHSARPDSLRRFH